MRQAIFKQEQKRKNKAQVVALRNEMRAFKRHYEADWKKDLPQLSNRINMEIIKVSDNYVLVYVYDARRKSYPNEDNFNRYKWIRVGSHFAFNNVWDMVNTVAINVRDAENF